MIAVMEPSVTPTPPVPNEDTGPVPLRKEGLPSSALLHLRPNTMPAPAPAVVSVTLPPPAPSPSFNREPVVPKPIPLPPPEPLYVPPIITPSVFETKPGLTRERKKINMKAVVLSSLAFVIVLIIVLYFWGAHLATT